MADDVKSWVDASIDTAFLLVYSKSYCPHSRRAKELLQSIQRKKEEATVFELDEMGDKGAEVQAYLLQRTGQRTVPNIFIQGKHIGGASDLLALHDAGKLEPMITLTRSRHFAAPSSPSARPSLFVLGFVLLLVAAGFLCVRAWRRRPTSSSIKHL